MAKYPVMAFTPNQYSLLALLVSVVAEDDPDTFVDVLNEVDAQQGDVIDLCRQFQISIPEHLISHLRTT